MNAFLRSEVGRATTTKKQNTYFGQHTRSFQQTTRKWPFRVTQFRVFVSEYLLVLAMRSAFFLSRGITQILVSLCEDDSRMT